MKKTYFRSYRMQKNAAEDGESIVKRFMWVAVIVAALFAIQDRMNFDSEKFQQEQASLKSKMCN